MEIRLDQKNAWWWIPALGIAGYLTLGVLAGVLTLVLSPLVDAGAFVFLILIAVTVYLARDAVLKWYEIAKLREQRSKHLLDVLKVRRQAHLDLLRDMHPQDEFEPYVADLFATEGWSTQVTKKTGDHGGDIVMTRDGKKAFVECKCYAEAQTVGEPELRAFLGAIIKEGDVDEGYFVTTSTFTAGARRFVKGLPVPIELIDGRELISKIHASSTTKRGKDKLCLVCKS